MSNLSTLFKRFEFSRILSSDPLAKTVVALGTIEGKDAIVSLEKTAFVEDNFLRQVSDISQINANDIYYWGMNVLEASLEVPSSKMNLIYPATEKHIKKYDAQKLHMVKETPEMYEQVVKPYIETMKGDRIQWVRNILFNNYEADKIVYKDDDLILLPDMKWDGTTLDSLYLVCIVKREDISSLRDLNESHVEYLEKISATLKKQTSVRYGIDEDQLRLFVHYQPSYYHFHIHVVAIQHKGLGFGIACGKANLLEDIIENLKITGPKGYANRTITYALGENHDLWKLGLN